MSTIDLTVSLYFSTLNDKLSLGEILELTNELSAYVNRKVDYLTYTILDTKGRLAYKDVKLNESNIKKLYQYHYDNKIKNVGLMNLSNDGYIRSRDNDLSMLLSYATEAFPLNSLILRLNTDVISIQDTNGISNILDKIFSMMRDINARIAYGVVFPMERIKFPTFYALGISSEALTEHEKHKSFLWGNY